MSTTTRHDRLFTAAAKLPVQDRTLYIAVRYNPQDAYRNSDFVQTQFAMGVTVEDAILGDVASILESDDITAAGDVNDVTPVLRLAQAILRYSFIGPYGPVRYVELSAREQAILGTEHNYERLLAFAEEGR